MKKILFVVNVDWFFLSHRLPLALEAKSRGYDVTICAIETGKREVIESYGFHFIPLPTTRSGRNLFNELYVIYFLFKLYKKIKPDIIHHVGIKPVTYGSLAARFLPINKIINAIAGFGFLFINKTANPISHKLVIILIKLGFSNKNIRVIVQNNHDFKEVQSLKVVPDNNIFIIKGSGIDLDKFYYKSPEDSKIINIILPARMLWDKGVGEFVGAAEILVKKYKNLKFFLVGSTDFENNSSISEAQLKEWHSSGVVTWLGHQDQMLSIYQSAHIVVLPSYREGLPKSLIEACAVGRPIVTTDVPGCNEVVINGFNGYLVKKTDTIDLANCIEILILDPELRLAMGKNARKLAIDSFSIQDVVLKTFFIYNN